MTKPSHQSEQKKIKNNEFDFKNFIKRFGWEDWTLVIISAIIFIIFYSYILGYT
ncbi:MAG: hypothetical protein QXG00_03475 [Candidatus Woesearchaeota archaeon]